MGIHADDLIDQYDYDGEWAEFRVYCKYCGDGPFAWGEIAPDVWRLHNTNGVIHKCAGRKATEEFSAVEPKEEEPKPEKGSDYWFENEAY
jgi:hypothetical protein